MKKAVLVAVLAAAAIAAQPGWAAAKKKGPPKCSPAVAEAEQAVRFMTDLMVVSSECQDTVYAEFRLRNQVPIRAYQKTLISHFHGNRQFDTWNTSLANQYSQKRAGIPTAQICQQAADLLKTAQTLDPEGFRHYARTQAETPGMQTAVCAR